MIEPPAQGVWPEWLQLKWLSNLHDIQPKKGLWTPVIEGQTSAGVGTYSQTVGSYTRIDKTILIKCHIGVDAHTGTGDMWVTGLPFISSAVSDTFSCLAVRPYNLAVTAGNYVVAYVDVNTQNIILEQVATGGGSTSGIPIDTSFTLLLSGYYDID